MGCGVPAQGGLVQALGPFGVRHNAGHDGTVPVLTGDLLVGPDPMLLGLVVGVDEIPCYFGRHLVGRLAFFRGELADSCYVVQDFFF